MPANAGALRSSHAVVIVTVKVPASAVEFALGLADGGPTIFFVIRRGGRAQRVTTSTDIALQAQCLRPWFTVAVTPRDTLAHFGNDMVHVVRRARGVAAYGRGSSSLRR
jgi:hypothetical protein